jgi:uncharacterized membrane protein YjjB (DUF3815 family)
VGVKSLAISVPVVFSAAVALIASLVAIGFTSDIGTLLYLIGVAIVGTLALVLRIALRRGHQQRIVSVAAFGAFLILTVGVVISRRQIRPHLLWLVWSNRYKSEVQMPLLPMVNWSMWNGMVMVGEVE